MTDDGRDEEYEGWELCTQCQQRPRLPQGDMCEQCEDSWDE